MVSITEHTQAGGLHTNVAGLGTYDEAFRQAVEARMKKGKISMRDLLKARDEVRARFPQLDGKPHATACYGSRGRSEFRRKILDWMVEHPEEAEKRYGKAAREAIEKALEETTEKGRRKLLKRLLAAAPGPVGLAISLFFFPEKVEAKGVVGAATDEVFDQMPLVEWFKAGVKILGDRDMILDKDQRADAKTTTQKYCPPVGTSEYGRRRYELDHFGRTPPW